MTDEEITDKAIYDACDTIRKAYLRLDERVMPLKDRINNAKYYGSLKLKLVVMKHRSETKQAESKATIPT